MRKTMRRAVASSVLLAALSFASRAGATAATMNYCVEDIGGLYQYTFTLTLDNHDGTWAPGWGIGWVIFADAPSPGPSLLNDFVGDPASLPIGPWTGYGTSGGGHNGPNLAPVVVLQPPYPANNWVPTAVGESITWRGTSSHLVTPDQMQWSNLFTQGGAGYANWENMTNVCGVTGACCMAATCQVLTAQACTNAGGTYNGDGSHCSSCGPQCDSADFDCDGDTATDADIESFFRCLAGNCPQAPCTNSADFNHDGDSATDADIESFFRVLAGGPC